MGGGNPVVTWNEMEGGEVRNSGELRRHNTSRATDTGTYFGGSKLELDKNKLRVIENRAEFWIVYWNIHFRRLFALWLSTDSV